MKQRLLQNTLQLAEVSRPGMTSKCPDGFCRYGLNALVELGAEFSDEEADEKRQVFQPLAERRELDRENV